MEKGLRFAIREGGRTVGAGTVTEILEVSDRPMREIITLACTACKRRNYSNTRNKKKQTERLEINKYCPFCRKHTSHKEVK